MPRQIWNEGRVVGFSAYEVYLKHALSIDPNHEPATEKEWLASMMAMGSSMLLRIGTTTEPYIDVPFPADSRLCAANNILASVFTGEGYVGSAGLSEHVWCTKVTDYGPLLDNTENTALAGERQAENMPISSNGTALTDDQIAGIHEYMKIVDGLVLQPGTWIDNPNKPPEKDFVPTTLQKDEATGQETTVTLAHVPTLRIAFSEPVTQPFFILLTGFTNRSVVTGVTGFFDPQRPVDVGYDSAVNTQSPQDGDFLGPWAFPWAAKVIFSVPSAYISYFMNNKYTRQLPSYDTPITIQSDPIIDMEAADPFKSYYSSQHKDAPVDMNVQALHLTGKDAAVLATYRHYDSGTYIPPALYGAVVSETGEVKICPIDTVAPYSLHIYPGSIVNRRQTPFTKAALLENAASGAVAFLRDGVTYVVSQLDDANNNYTTPLDRVIPVSDDVTENQQQFSVANTPYMWLFKHSDDAVDDEFDNVTAMIVNKFIHGTLSQSLVSEYAFTYQEVNDLQKYTAPSNGEISGLNTLALQKTVLFDMFNSIPETERANYNYILRGGYTKQDAPSQQYFFMPIHKDTNMVSIMSPMAIDLKRASGSENLHMQSDGKLDYLGSWFSGTALTGDDLGYGNYAELKRHPLQKFAITQDSIFYQPNAVTPCPPADKYKFDFLQWFKDTNVTDMIPSSKFATYGIHSSYKKLSIYEFLQCCCSRDLSINFNSDDSYIASSDTRFEFKMYLYSRDAVANLKISDVSASTAFDANHELVAGVVVHSRTSPNTFFYDAPTQFNAITDSLEVGDDITESCVSTQNAIWASVGKSGHHITKAISLVDKEGIPLPRLGSAGVIAANNVIWEDLIVALNQNKSIDLLGAVLKGLKSDLTGSGPDHLEFANGLRLYVSNTKPTDTDIPDGSIGIGW